MNVIIIHGDNFVESYERLQKLINVAKGRGWEIFNIENSKMSLSEAVSSLSLFEKEKLIVAGDINDISAKDINFLKKNRNLSVSVIIYYNGVLNKTFIKKFVDPKVEEYSIPKLIWKFIDSFYPGNGIKCLKILKQVTKTDTYEFVFTMLARHLKDLYWVKNDPKGLGYPEWRLTKLQFQAGKFTNQELKEIINDMAEIDLEVKSSRVKLSDALDFLIAGKLE